MLMLRERQASRPHPQQREETMSAKRKADSDSKAASRPRIMKSQGNSRADSERDSGFSDASSEHMSLIDTADSEDSPRPFMQSRSQKSVVRGSYSHISPMIIMNNVLLKQPENNPAAMKSWGFRPAVEVVQPVVQQPQVVFLQPVVSRRASSATKEASRHRRPKKYLPILKSYPKIAPHPGDSSSSSGRSTASSSFSSSSSSSSGSEKGGTLASSHRDNSQKEKHQKSESGRLGPLSGTPISSLPQSRLPQTSNHSEPPAPAVSGPELTPSPALFSSLTPLEHREDTSPVEQKCDDDDDDTRRKRFCNTYNILCRSGLLDITLRTKELLRQNRRTQTDLDRLRQHTDLFLQAVGSGDADIYVKLHASLQEDEDKERERLKD